jgi:hypothetical protein
MNTKSTYPHYFENEIAHLNPDGSRKNPFYSKKIENAWRNDPLCKKYELVWNFLKEIKSLRINVEDPFVDIDSKLNLLNKYTSIRNLYIGSEKNSDGKTIKVIKKSLESCAKDSNSSRLGEVFKTKVDLARDILNGKKLNNKF